MLEIIVITLFISLASNIVLKKFHLPTIIGYIVTGTIVAYGFDLHDAVHNHELKEIAEFGVVFLMFTIGLEFSVNHLKRMRYEVFVAGTMQIMVTAVAAFLIAFHLLGLETKTALVLSLAVALSSTAIVLKTFNDSGEINRRYGQRALGILIMQDIAVIPILLLLGFLSSDGGSVGAILLETFLQGAILLALLVFSGKYLLNPFFTLITKTHSDELFVGSILFIAIGASYLAHMLGFSYSLGAFIAGMLISETKFKHQAEADLVPFRDLLLGVFFITVGMQIDFGVIAEYLGAVLLLLAAVLAAKFLIIYGVVRLREKHSTSFKTALALVQIGEFSLAVLELARSGGLVAPPYGQIMIVTIVLSMILTPVILKNLDRIGELFLREEEGFEGPSEAYEGMHDHVVILGFGEFGRGVARALKEREEAYMVVENDINRFHQGQHAGEPIIFGNALKKEVLESSSLRHAGWVIVAIDNPRKLRQICETIEKIIDKRKIVVKVHTYWEKELISDMELGRVVVENQLIAETVATIVSEESVE